MNSTLLDLLREASTARYQILDAPWKCEDCETTNPFDHSADCSALVPDPASFERDVFDLSSFVADNEALDEEELLEILRALVRLPIGHQWTFDQGAAGLWTFRRLPGEVD